MPGMLWNGFKYPELSAEDEARVTEVRQFFRRIAFDVDWDLDLSTGNHWHELWEGKRILLQIDFSAPLSDLRSDLPLLAAGQPSTCASNWQVRGSLEDLQRITWAMALWP
jgi:hypothetical protein